MNSQERTALSEGGLDDFQALLRSVAILTERMDAQQRLIEAQQEALRRPDVPWAGGWASAPEEEGPAAERSSLGSRVPFRLPSLADRFCQDAGIARPLRPDRSLVDVLGRGPGEADSEYAILKPIIGATDECEVPLSQVDEDLRTLDKWERIVKLPPLAIEEEVQLLQWEEGAAIAMMGKGVPSHVFAMLVSQQQELVSTAIILRREGWRYGSLGEFVAELTDERNFDDSLIEQMLAFLDRPPRATSVLVAVQLYEKTLKRLRRLCKRHSYAPGLTATRLRNALLARLPAEVERHLIKMPELNGLTYKETKQVAMTYEQRLKRADGRAMPALVLAMEERRPLKCFNCNGEHFKSKCKEPAHKCDRCRRSGHLEEHCPTTVLKDKFGRERMKVTEGRKGFNSNLLLDNTRKDHLETHAARVQRELDQIAARSKRRPQRDDEAMNVAVEDGGEDEPRPEDDDDDENEALATDEELDEVHPCFAATDLAGKGLATASASVEGHAATVILDSGASISLISPSDCARFQLTTGTRQLQVKGVSGVMRARQCDPCTVTIGQKPCEVTFCVGQGNELPPIIGGKDISQNGIDLLYSQGLVGLGEAYDPVPLVLSLQDEAGDQATEQAMSELAEIIEEAGEQGLKATTGQALVEPVAIPTNGTEPKRVPPRVIPQPVLPKVLEWANKLLAEGSLEKAPDAKHFSPLVLVQQREGKTRMVVDYRERNKTLSSHGYPLPRIDDLHRFLPRHRWFSAIDLKSGFHNIPLEPSSRDLTAIYVPSLGPLRFTVLPFGLTPAPTIFQAIIEGILHDQIIDDIARVYIDDIVVVGQTQLEVARRTTMVIRKLLEARLRISIEKLKPAVQCLKFLGHMVSFQEVKPDPERCAAICEAAFPPLRKDLRRWLGAAAYLRSFIPGFARIAAPLTSEAPRRGALPKSPDLLAAFAALKAAVAHTVTLYSPKDGRAFELFVDASDWAIGAALFQKWEKDDVPIGYYSRKLTETQRKWCATDREVYAILWALRTTASICLGAPLTVFTDHAALTHLGSTPTPKLIRYGLAIRAFGAQIRHVKGKDNVVADFLSRLDGHEVDAGIEGSYALLSLDEVTNITPEKLAAATREEGENAELEEKEGIFLLRHTRKAYVPKKYREQLIYLAHAYSGGHVGVGKTIKILTRNLWWPKLADEVASFVAGCLLCQCFRRKKSEPGKGLLERPFFNEIVSLDYVGPRQFDGAAQYALVLVDHCTRFAAGVSTTEPSASVAWDFVRHRWISFFGNPTLILTDNNPFGKDFSALVRVSQSQHITCLPYHPEGNGINESAHRLIEYAMMTRRYHRKETYEDLLQQALLVHNAVPHVSTGEAPHYLLTGMDPAIPGWALFTRQEPTTARLIGLK